jgi:hypothetical protein
LGDGGTLYAIRERVGTEIVAGVSQVLYVHRPNLTTRMQTSLTVPGGMDSWDLHKSYTRPWPRFNPDSPTPSRR